MDDDPILCRLYEATTDPGLKRVCFDTWSADHLGPSAGAEIDQEFRAATERLRALLAMPPDLWRTSLGRPPAGE